MELELSATMKNLHRSEEPQPQHEHNKQTRTCVKFEEDCENIEGKSRQIRFSDNPDKKISVVMTNGSNGSNGQTNSVVIPRSKSFKKPGILTRLSSSKSRSVLKNRSFKRQATMNIFNTAFVTIDYDHDGRISAKDIAFILNLSYPNLVISSSQIEEILKIKFPAKVKSGKQTQILLDMDDFHSLMIHFAGGSPESAQKHFEKIFLQYFEQSNDSNVKSPFYFAISDLQLNDSINVNNNGNKKNNVVGGESDLYQNIYWFRFNLLKRLNSTPVQILLLFLVFVDCFCVGMELLLYVFETNTPEACNKIKSSEINTTTTIEKCTEYYNQSCNHMNSTRNHIYEVEEILNLISIIILVIFLIQILLTLLATGIKFFSHSLFVFDLIVIGVGLLLEALVRIKGGALVILLLVWRSLRIINALSSTIEIHDNKTVVQETMKNDQMKAVLAKKVSSAFELHLDRSKDVISAIRSNVGSREEFKGNTLRINGTILDSYEDEVEHSALIEKEYIHLYTTSKHILADLKKIQKDFAELQEKVEKHELITQPSQATQLLR